ncbi:sushi domain-containing protein [Caerostris extrusa]|uniref:Sushi domain-containing protein n=1 Tax=Caerostris extrusa TaxID=172846 RepID=A0AAV4RZJ1_CAEEX|nr:sushi domain-containing protein [Caerostris extrusa]
MTVTRHPPPERTTIDLESNLCRQWSKQMRLVFLDLHCDEQPAPENGAVKVTGEMFGDTAAYTCKDGYWLSGNRDRVCQGDATWSGKQPECKLKIGCELQFFVSA